ncbi:MAG TPA: sugar phosphate nucleotidyltransferase [Candidatus Nitrosotalea sp.]|nr:sugar phosphate nucleotidyltransferase [Candidatus Nitrosotalea sp.]
MASRAAPVFAAIPAGGVGSRLWPRSRRASPKHVLSLSGSGQPLLIEAYERIRPLVDEVFVVTEEPQAEMILDLIPGLGREHLIVEPAARGTTNALGLAAMTLAELDPQALMLSTAADHVISGQRAFARAIESALQVARSSPSLVTVGLKPRFPSSGFGYIESGGRVRIGGRLVDRVAAFVEKPDAELARRYMEGGRHFWNLSLFAFQLGAFLNELRQFGPRHHAGLLRVLAARRAGDEARAAAIYTRLPVAAIDYTVMERSQRLYMIRAGFQWSDVGSWADLAQLLAVDGAGNASQGEALLVDCRGVFVSASDRLVVGLGLEDLVVVDTDDAILIMPKARAQDVKGVVAALKRAGRDRYL